jgi:hypothetical protein
MLERGEKIKLKVRLLDGWKGTGVFLYQIEDTVYFIKSGDPEGEVLTAMRWEVSAGRHPR